MCLYTYSLAYVETILEPINHVHDYRIYHSSGENIVADYKDCMKKLRRGKTPDYINIKKFTINIKTQERQMLLKQIFNTLYEITSIYL